MAKEIKLPQLGQTMEEGTIVNCLVKVGDEVKRGDVIFEVETDKATLEMESPADGVVKHILAQIDQTLLVGAPMMVLGDKDEEVPQSFVDALTGGASTPAAAPEAPAVAAPVETVAEPEPARPTGRIMASPRAKRLAAEMGVDLTRVRGTGPAGKITEVDIRKAAAGTAPAPTAQPAPTAPAPAPAPAPAAPRVPAGEVRLGSAVPVNRLQRITAERMLKSKQEIPCFYLTVRADVTEMVAKRAQLNATGDVKVAYNDFIIKAVATGLEKFPLMTGQLAGNVIQLVEAVHIGLAISVTDGLVAPLVKDVNKKSLMQIARDSQALIERARNDKLDLSDLEGGCITVSNLGAFGIESFIPIVVPGQCTILGIGQIADTCVPDNGNLLVRKLMNMTLSVDHKVANGAYAAQFLDFVRKLLEDPSSLV
ncbi:MAG: 2-oxo acid dehydrogenase subunit E2 [Phycisphaerales bacterium]|nr:MAG: 2-oxo acid dehydrogenase subunit E2 [Phycisphaerales bacterium]